MLNMAKKSHKRSPRLRKENSSCIGGLISMFDFRQGRSTQRLLSDKKRGNAGNLGVSYPRSKNDLPCKMEESHGDPENLANLPDTEAHEDKVNLGVTTIKALMDKEMSKMHHSRKESNSKIDLIKAELELEANAEISHNELVKNSSIGSNDHGHDLNVSTRLILQQSDYPNISELPSSETDVAAFMVDYCSTSFQYKGNDLEFKNNADQYPYRESIEDFKKSELDNESVVILQRVIVDIAKAHLKQKPTTSSKLVGNTEVQRSEEFNSAIEMLNSNKDLFLKLLGDLDSRIRKHIEDLQNVGIGKPSKIEENQLLEEVPGSKQPQKQSSQHFFRKREKLTVANQSNEYSDAKLVNRIVVLKPSLVKNQNPSNTVNSISAIQLHCGLENKEDEARLSSHFSLKEIKRKLKNAVGASRNERLSIAMDGNLHEIPRGKQISGKNETSCRREAIKSKDEKKSNTKEIQKKNELSFSTNSLCERQKLNKDAASQMIYREAAFYVEARKHLSDLIQTESKTGSLPAIQVSKSLGRILSFPEFNYFSPILNPAREKKPDSPPGIFLCHKSHDFDTKCLSPSTHKESFPKTDKSQEAKNGSMNITEVEYCMHFEEGNQVEAQFVSNSDEDDLPSEIFKKEGSSMLLEPVKVEKMFQPSTPSSSTASSSAELLEPRDSECATDNNGRPSPISVLESLCFEDASSPASLITEHGTNAERKTQPREPQIETYVAASGLIDSEANPITCMEFDEASLFDEMEISYGLLINDPKFLFDSIDEVVTEIKERHCSCTPWVSLISPSVRPLQKQEDFINQAYKLLNRHLDVQYPLTIHHAVKKDFDGGAWFNLQFEAEDAVAEIGNEILNYLFEEIALELWD